MKYLEVGKKFRVKKNVVAADTLCLEMGEIVECTHMCKGDEHSRFFENDLRYSVKTTSRKYQFTTFDSFDPFDKYFERVQE